MEGLVFAFCRQSVVFCWQNVLLNYKLGAPNNLP
jgi:hypothetical protein